MVLFISPGRKVLLMRFCDHLFLKCVYLSADFTAYYCVWVVHHIEFCMDTYVQLFKYVCLVICYISKGSLICFQVLFSLFLYCLYIIMCMTNEAISRMTILFCFCIGYFGFKRLGHLLLTFFTLLISINIDFHYL